MEPVAIPKTIDDPIHLLLWSADEIVPFMVCMLTGMLIDQFIPALALGVIAVKFYRRFPDNRPDGYTLHAIDWLGLLPSKALTIPNPFLISPHPSPLPQGEGVVFDFLKTAIEPLLAPEI